ncbi:MAG: hypothetical protein AB7P35_17760 [Hyphomonadaceae bacterium]
MKLRLQYVTAQMGRGDLYQILDANGVYQLAEPLPYEEAVKARDALLNPPPPNEQWTLAGVNLWAGWRV